MNQTTKTELISIAHTFVGVLVPVVMMNLNLLDINNLTKESLFAFGIAVFRSVVKTMYNAYFPPTSTN
jgi:ABC-type enterochelin transport system permease subunit